MRIIAACWLNLHDSELLEGLPLLENDGQLIWELRQTAMMLESLRLDGDTEPLPRLHEILKDEPRLHELFP